MTTNPTTWAEMPEALRLAERLLREAAEELKAAHTIGGLSEWDNSEPEVRAAYEAYIAAADGLAALSAAAPAAPAEGIHNNAEKVKPMFWVRLCSDGGYEGPLHDDRIEHVRKLSGAWHPLYLGAAPQAQQPIATYAELPAPDHALDGGDQLFFRPDQMRTFEDATCALRAARAVQQAAELAPIDMALHCPACGLQHIDADEWEDDPHDIEQGRILKWKNEPHRSHLCHGCGHIWRPADVPTNGVAAVKTAGKADSPIAARAGAQAVPVAQTPDASSLGSEYAKWIGGAKNGRIETSIERLGGAIAAAIARYAAPTAVSAPKLPSHEELADLLASGLRGTWHCGRVWEAWHVGTMSEDDFSPADESDTPGELADAVLALLAAAPKAPAGEGGAA